MIKLIFIISILMLSLIQDDKQPRFQEYETPITYKGKPAKIQQFDLSNYGYFRSKSQFRQEMQKAIAKGPNFADNYSIVQWGENACFYYAIINAATGKVYFPSNGGCVGLVFKRNSKLLISDPIDSSYYQRKKGKIAEYINTSFFVWENEELTQIYSTQKPLQFEYELTDNIINSN